MLAAGGRPTGFGYESGVLDLDAFDAPIEASIESLGLWVGRFNLRIDLMSAGEIVATRHESIQVRAHPPTDDSFTAMPARWGQATRA